jgi:hypothetical protein
MIIFSNKIYLPLKYQHFLAYIKAIITFSSYMLVVSHDLDRVSIAS